MTKNPLINALAAVGYIILVALFLAFIPPYIPEPAHPFGPISAVLSLFVFSAATMGYLVIGMPLRLFLEGEKTEAVALFVKTLVAFAVLSLLLFLFNLIVPIGA